MEFIELGGVLETLCSLYLPDVGAALTGPLHQGGLEVAGMIGDGADDARSLLCKH